MRQPRLALSLFVLSCSIAFADATKTSPTNTLQSDPINIGMSVSLTGQNSWIGENISGGANTYFDKINAQGGVQGHLIRLLVKDDNYNPVLSIQNVRNLITKDKVIAIMGNNGSASAIAILPVLNTEKVLFFGPFSGAPILYKTPPDRYVLPVRINYDQDVRLVVKRLIKAGFKGDDFAFFLQDDAFGSSIYQPAIQELKASGYANPELLPVAFYRRNTLNVEGAAVQLLSTPKKPKVIILGGTVAPNTKFVNLTENELAQTYFVGFGNFINPNELIPSAQGQVLISQATPYYKESTLPAIKEYLADLKKYGNGQEPGAISFLGYLIAKIMVIGLNQAVTNHQLTREGLIDTFQSMHNVDAGIGVNFSFSPQDHQALNEIWIRIFDGKDFVPVNWPELSKKISGKQTGAN